MDVVVEPPPQPARSPANIGPVKKATANVFCPNKFFHILVITKKYVQTKETIRQFLALLFP